MARTLVTGNILRSGSIPTTALGGGVVTSSAQIVSALPGGTLSSSAQVTNVLPADVVSSSVQVTAFLPTDTVSSSAQVTAFLPVNTVSSSGQVTAFLPTGTVSSSTQLPSGIASSSAQVTEYLPTGTVSSSGQVDVFSTVGGDSLATTGSNTFTGVTAISDTTNSTSYLNGALTVAGGMSVQKDVRISGSMTINGLLTVVSMSSQYVTSSQYNLGVSKVTVNDDDNVRFAGLSVFDSGSSSPTTASIFWDSLQHRFIYENLSGSSYNSAIIIAGPKNTGSLGSEAELTTGYIPYATGGDHIDNSVMFQSGSRIGVGVVNPSATLQVQGNVSASSFTGSLSGTVATAAQTNITSLGTLSSLTVGGTTTISAPAANYGTLNITAPAGYGSQIKLGEATDGYRAAIMYNVNVGNGIEFYANGTGAVNNVGFWSSTGLTIGGDLTVDTSTLKVDSTNNRVGIGTASPTNPLHVEGATVLFKNGSSNVSHYMGTSAYGWRLDWSAGDFIWTNNNVDTLRLTLAGNLGLGVTPSAWAGSFKAIQVGNGSISSNATTTVYVSSNFASEGSGDKYISTGAAAVYAQNNGQHRWYNAPSGTAGNTISFTQAMTLDASGNLLIGTTDGNFVNGIGLKIANATAARFKLCDSDVGVGASDGFELTAAGSDAYIYNYESGFLAFGTGVTERARITSAGNVGIGTTNPGSRLTVSGSIESLVDAVGGTDEGGQLILRAPSGGSKRWNLDNYKNNLRIFYEDDSNSANGYVALAITGSNGNVGIGTTNPSSKLHIFSNTSPWYATVLAEGAVGRFAVKDPDDAYVGSIDIQNYIAFNLSAGTDASYGAITERMRITNTGILSISNSSPPALSGVSGIVIGSTLILTGEFFIPSPYTSNVQIDIVYNNWGSNNVIGIVDITAALREYANTAGTAFGKIFATNTSSGATFTTFNTTNVTTSQCTISVTCPANYTLRITIDPSNVTDRGSIYMVIPGAGGTGTSVSSVTMSVV